MHSSFSSEKELEDARRQVAELACIEFIEIMDGKVPSDSELARCGISVQFNPSPQSLFRRNLRAYSRFFCWRRCHALAYGFFDPQLPLELSSACVPPGAWPEALRLYVDQYPPQ